jgi:hypothetical protein
MELYTSKNYTKRRRTTMIEKISKLIERDEFLGNTDLKERFKSAQMVKKLNVEKIKTFERFNPFRYGGLFNPKEVCRLGDDKYDNPDEPYDDEEEE